jgi:hypothetical protein
MRIFILFVFCLLSLPIWGEEVSLWSSKLPGFRKLVDTSALPERLFSIKVETTSTGPQSPDDPLADAIQKVGTLPVSGLVWSHRGSERRVLIGDFVLREGQAIPAYVFKDGRYYTLEEIFPNRLRFKAQTADLAQSLIFEIRFDFTNKVNNQSKYSGDAQQ